MSFFKLLQASNRGHALMTKTLEKQIPRIHENKGDTLGDKKVYIKYFALGSNWTWYAMEYDPAERVFFGYVVGFEKEFGYFSLDELESLGGAINRDLHFTPQPLKDIKDYEA